MAKTISIIVGSILLVILLIFGLFVNPSDSELINKAMVESIEGARDGRPGSVIDHLARSFQFNGQSMGSTVDVMKVVRIMKPNAVFENLTPQIDGSQAYINSGVRLTYGGGDQLTKVDINKVTVTLQKSTGFKWLVFPTPEWKIADVKAENFDGSELLGGL